MWARSPKVPASSRQRPAPVAIDRRTFLGGLVALLGWPGDVLGTATAASPARESTASPLPAATRTALRTSAYVYVSPLRSDGSESTCHGEVWFGWLDGSVVVTAATSTWKVRALARKLERARIWVGDFGRWKRLVGRNEAFREGPSFLARGRIVEDAALLERLLTLYGEKYPEEFGSWDARMRAGHASGKRVLIRYEPVATESGVTRPDAEDS